MKEIPLTKDKVAIVDDEDYEKLTKFKWNWTLQNNQSNEYARGNVMMHNVIMDTPSGQEVDHINGNGLDNRRANLRLCTHSENNHNRRRTSKRQLTSRFKGVHRQRDHRKWVAQIKKDGAQLNIGYFDSEEEAARAYDRKAKELFGDYANLNFEPVGNDAQSR